VKLALLGATGGVDREVLSQALAVGHLVTAVVRSPSTLSTNVDVVRQDLATSDAEVLAGALRDVDAVISAVGLTGQAGTVAPATAAITHGIASAGVRRLVVISVRRWASCPRPTDHSRLATILATTCSCATSSVL
jgi:putative NADH-flavin reductase